MNKKLFEEALKLPVNERVVFAELILASLEQEHEEVKAAWVQEVKDRYKAVEEDKAKLLDFEALYNAS